MAKQREAERKLAPTEIPQEGCDVLLSGKDKDGKAKNKALHVTPASRCSDWFKLKLSPDGHETLEIAELTDLARSCGWESFKVQHGEPEPAPKPEPAKPLPVAVRAAK